MHQKYEEKPMKSIKLYFRKCSLTITNLFEGEEFENDHCFSGLFSIFEQFAKNGNLHN